MVVGLRGGGVPQGLCAAVPSATFARERAGEKATSGEADRAAVDPVDATALTHEAAAGRRPSQGMQAGFFRSCCCCCGGGGSNGGSCYYCSPHLEQPGMVQGTTDKCQD